MATPARAADPASQVRRQQLARRARLAAPRVLPAVPFVGLLVVWVIGWQIYRPELVTLPSVSRVVSTFGDLMGSGELVDNVVASLGRWAVGFFVGAVTGLVLGIMVGLSPLLFRCLDPIVTFFTAMSGIVWLPLAIVWFGLGTVTVTFIIWNSVFFLVFANTMLGVRSVPRVLEDGLRTLGANRADVIFRVIIPGSLPHVMQGMRMGVGFGWRALIAAEIIGATTGVGAMIYQAKEYFLSDVIIIGVVLLAIIGLVLDVAILAPIERRTIVRWGLVSENRGRVRVD